MSSLLAAFSADLATAEDVCLAAPSTYETSGLALATACSSIGNDLSQARYRHMHVSSAMACSPQKDAAAQMLSIDGSPTYAMSARAQESPQENSRLTAVSQSQPLDPAFVIERTVQRSPSFSRLHRLSSSALQQENHQKGQQDGNANTVSDNAVVQPAISQQHTVFHVPYRLTDNTTTTNSTTLDSFVQVDKGNIDAMVECNSNLSIVPEVGTVENGSIKPQPLNHILKPQLVTDELLQEQTNQNYVTASTQTPTLEHLPPADLIPQSLPTSREEALSKELWTMYKVLLPSDADLLSRKLFVDKMRKMFEREWPEKRVTVYLFGSAVNKLGTRGSDVDICLTSTRMNDRNNARHMYDIASLLRKNGVHNIDMSKVHARVPVVRFTDPEFNVSCDINVNNPLALYNTLFIKHYASASPIVRPFMLLVKYWTQRRVLNDAAGGSLSSYCWCIMMIYFLQRIGVVSVDAMEAVSSDFARWEQPTRPTTPVILSRSIPNTSQEHIDVNCMRDIEKLSLPVKKTQTPLPQSGAIPLPDPATLQIVSSPVLDPNDSYNQTAHVIVPTGESTPSRTSYTLGALFYTFFRFYAFEFDYPDVVVGVRGLETIDWDAVQMMMKTAHGSKVEQWVQNLNTQRTGSPECDNVPSSHTQNTSNDMTNGTGHTTPCVNNRNSAVPPPLPNLLIPKMVKFWHASQLPTMDYRVLCVEDPLNPSRNLANNASPVTINGLRKELWRTCFLLLNQREHPDAALVSPATSSAPLSSHIINNDELTEDVAPQGFYLSRICEKFMFPQERHQLQLQQQSLQQQQYQQQWMWDRAIVRPLDQQRLLVGHPQAEHNFSDMPTYTQGQQLLSSTRAQYNNIPAGSAMYFSRAQQQQQPTHSTASYEHNWFWTASAYSAKRSSSLQGIEDMLPSSRSDVYRATSASGSSQPRSMSASAVPSHHYHRPQYQSSSSSSKHNIYYDSSGQSGNTSGYQSRVDRPRKGNGHSHSHSGSYAFLPLQTPHQQQQSDRRRYVYETQAYTHQLFSTDYQREANGHPVAGMVTDAFSSPVMSHSGRSLTPTHLQHHQQHPLSYQQQQPQQYPHRRYHHSHSIAGDELMTTSSAIDPLHKHSSIADQSVIKVMSNADSFQTPRYVTSFDDRRERSEEENAGEEKKEQDTVHNIRRSHQPPPLPIDATTSGAINGSNRSIDHGGAKSADIAKQSSLASPLMDASTHIMLRQLRLSQVQRAASERKRSSWNAVAGDLIMPEGGMSSRNSASQRYPPLPPRLVSLMQTTNNSAGTRSLSAQEASHPLKTAVGGDSSMRLIVDEIVDPLPSQLVMVTDTSLSHVDGQPDCVSPSKSWAQVAQQSTQPGQFSDDITFSVVTDEYQSSFISSSSAAQALSLTTNESTIEDNGHALMRGVSTGHSQFLESNQIAAVQQSISELMNGSELMGIANNSLSLSQHSVIASDNSCDKRHGFGIEHNAYMEGDERGRQKGQNKDRSHTVSSVSTFPTCSSMSASGTTAIAVPSYGSVQTTVPSSEMIMHRPSPRPGNKKYRQHHQTRENGINSDVSSKNTSQRQHKGETKSRRSLSEKRTELPEQQRYSRTRAS